MNKLFNGVFAYFSSDSFRIPPAVFVLLVTLFSFGWVLGYSVYEGDQLIYFPELLKRLDPGLFPRDLIFSQDGFTFFDDAILAGIRILRLDIFSVLFLMVFALRFVYFWGVYKIFKNLTGDRPFSLLAPLLYRLCRIRDRHAHDRSDASAERHRNRFRPFGSRISPQWETFVGRMLPWNRDFISSRDFGAVSRHFLPFVFL